MNGGASLLGPILTVRAVCWVTLRYPDLRTVFLRPELVCVGLRCVNPTHGRLSCV